MDTNDLIAHETRAVASGVLQLERTFIQGRGSSAMIKISHSMTSDCLDGQPWPPPDSNTLWAVVRRADGYTHWRAIELAESNPLPRTFAISLGQQSQLKGSQHEEG